METETSTIECKKSADGKHCYHAIANPVLYLPGGSSDITEICCWCGATRNFTVTLPFSYTMNTAIHGPFQSMYYTMEEEKC